MRFSNFDLDQPFGSVELIGLGHRWDVHSWADLVVAEGSAAESSAVLEWRVPSNVENPWGSRGNQAVGCRLVFAGVSVFAVRPGVQGGDPRDRRTVSSISKVVPGAQEYPFKNEWTADERFDLRVETEDEGRIDVEADVATLEPILRLDG
jgi:hypothetical protein